MAPDAMRAALPSWRDTPTTTAIVDFLELVSHGPAAVPVEHRLATFDDDGTLAPEKPTSSLTAFLQSLPEERRAETLVERVEQVLPRRSGAGTQERIAARFAGSTVGEFEEQAAAFLLAERHPRFGRLWPTLTYAPMFELATLLRALDFTVYVVSGSSRDFLRTMAMPAFGARREHVIGTEVEIDFVDDRLVRTDRVVRPDVGRGKPAHIWDRCGGTPLLAAGNTRGDLEMLDSARFALLLDHDDAEREYRYTDDDALDAARTRGWTTISMRRDFRTLFSDAGSTDPGPSATGSGPHRDL